MRRANFTSLDSGAIFFSGSQRFFGHRYQYSGSLCQLSKSNTCQLSLCAGRRLVGYVLYTADNGGYDNKEVAKISL